MVTRVLSIVRSSDPGAPRAADPALDLNAFAVAEDVDLTLVLKDGGVELALAAATTDASSIAGVEVLAARPAADLRALLASGVRVLAVDADLVARGLRPDDLVADIEIVDEPTLSQLVGDHDVTLTSRTS